MLSLYSNEKIQELEDGEFGNDPVVIKFKGTIGSNYTPGQFSPNSA
jgi:hypothetical protein